MFKTIQLAMLPVLLFFGNGSASLLSRISQPIPQSNSGTVEKMMVESGTVRFDLEMNKVGGRSSAKSGGMTELQFDIQQDSFFTAVFFNDELRGPMPGAMKLIPRNVEALPKQLQESADRLAVERLPFDEYFEFAVRDVKTGYIFFNIEGHQFGYTSKSRTFSIDGGRLILSDEFARSLGSNGTKGTTVGNISISAKMRTIEIQEVQNGEVISDVMPARDPEAGTVPGPDVIVGDVYGLAQFGGSSGTQVGLALGTNSCNFGTENLNWFALPSNDHPVIPQNMYKMSGGPSNDARFEQIGQSSVKHAFTALTQNLCNLGCNGVGGSRLGSGCSDPYSASLNAGPNLGSRAWINPFTGDYPRGDSGQNPNTHSGHSHNGTTHRVLTEINDLNTSLNAGATYYAEGQYVTPHEYQWCQSNPGQCNMYNNVSYRQYSVSGTGSPFSFAPVSETQRQKPAINAWTGATLVPINPSPGNDGIGTLAYKVTETSPGVWHYEYAIYNQNIDRAISEFVVPHGSGATLSNIGFHAPPQHPGSPNDGTVGDAGFSATPWTANQYDGVIKWNTDTLAMNPNANAIRWGTMYNFRFDSTSPPQTVLATIGFFKTGEPITAMVQVPGGSLATVTVSGRVTNSTGRAVSNAVVVMNDNAGNVFYGSTNNFGNYLFTNVPAGGLYSIGVKSKVAIFPGKVVSVLTNTSGVDFVPSP